MVDLYALFGVHTPFDPDHAFVTSPFFSPTALAALRVTLATYATVTALFVLIWNSTRLHTGDQYFSYFTELSYTGLVSYLWAASVQTLVYVRRRGKGYPLQQWPRPLQFLHLLLTSTIMTFPIIVTVVFWGLLASPGTFNTKFSAWSNLSQHAFNTLFALIEITLTNAHPGTWAHLVPLVVLLAAYLGVAYITHATQGFYTYSFLDPTTSGGTLAGYIVGIAAGECVLFALVKGACYIRTRLTRGQKSAGGGSGDIEEEWQELERPRDSKGEKGVITGESQSSGA